MTGYRMKCSREPSKQNVSHYHSECQHVTILKAYLQEARVCSEWKDNHQSHNDKAAIRLPWEIQRIFQLRWISVKPDSTFYGYKSPSYFTAPHGGGHLFIIIHSSIRYSQIEARLKYVVHQALIVVRHISLAAHLCIFDSMIRNIAFWMFYEHLSFLRHHE